MSQLALLVRHGLIFGLVLSFLSGILIVTSLYLNPEMWLDDYPPDIKKRFGAMSEKAKRQRLLVSVLFLLMLLGIPVLALVRLWQVHGIQPLLAEAFLVTFVAWSVFNLVDLLVIDWLLIVRIRPARIVLPGTEGMPGYRDYGFHARGFLKGIVASVAVSLIVAAIAALIQALG